MEKPKPTQSLEQKQETPEDYVVATFPVDTDPDNARRPLTVIRSGQDGEDVKYDRGWNPIGMSVVLTLILRRVLVRIAAYGSI